ncbi:unnamed protein product [Paramecium octaurelia]|uniref:Uncharacterized protein n=1 Tax=Paramecium octaurelia TaxID=43137 RepID=A0A8S1YNF5_PAROT|nr:unnamed protein product [Paramecium octaurelia]
MITQSQTNDLLMQTLLQRKRLILFHLMFKLENLEKLDKNFLSKERKLGRLFLTQIKQKCDEFFIECQGRPYQKREQTFAFFRIKSLFFQDFTDKVNKKKQMYQFMKQSMYVNELTLIKWKLILCCKNIIYKDNSMQIKVDNHKYLRETTFCINKFIKSSNCQKYSKKNQQITVI